MKMSGKFNGFTKDDINKLTTKLNKENAISGTRNMGIRRMTDKDQIQKSAKVSTNKVQQPAINNNIKLIPTILADLSNDNITSSENSINNNLQDAIYFQPLKITNYAPEDESILPNISIDSHSCDDDIESNDKLSPFKGMSLKDFETHRKVIEEQNKQKKDMLYRTIEQHTERTAAEVKKLQEIKKELTKLDSDLAADVAILRKQIESASVQYLQTQKNYQQIESMFLKAKLDLHNAEEKKELLTEHLCTIIAHNEDRKAKKLSELMEKVGISSDNSNN